MPFPLFNNLFSVFQFKAFDPCVNCSLPQPLPKASCCERHLVSLWPHTHTSPLAARTQRGPLQCTARAHMVHRVQWQESTANKNVGNMDVSTAIDQTRTFTIVLMLVGCVFVNFFLLLSITLLTLTSYA